MENELNFASKIDNLVIVEKLIDDLSIRFKFNDEIYGNVFVALIEAVNNAIIHGNKCNPQKMVYLKYDVKDKFISFVIKDEGPGFNYNKIPDPTLPENIEKPDGRGLFLMKKLADGIKFLDKGTKIELKFKLA